MGSRHARLLAACGAAGRGTGPHLYEIGAEWVQRYFLVMQGCARAAQLRLEQRVAKSSVLG